MTMKICRNCGNAVKDNARFCGVCGAVLAGDEQLGVDTVFEPSEKPAAAKAPSNAQGHLDSEYDRMVKRDMGFKSPVDSDLDGKKQGALDPAYRAPGARRQGSLEEDRIRGEKEAEERRRAEHEREEREREERRREDMARQERLWEEHRREEELWDRRRRENLEREEMLRRERLEEEKRLEEERLRLEEEKKKRKNRRILGILLAAAAIAVCAGILIWRNINAGRNIPWGDTVLKAKVQDYTGHSEETFMPADAADLTELDLSNDGGSAQITDISALAAMKNLEKLIILYFYMVKVV